MKSALDARFIRAAVLIALVATALVVFWITAYPTITWWDSSGYSLAATTLGITSAPGSLLLTLLGWPVAKLPLGLTPAHALNLFAGALAAATAALVYICALRLSRLARAGEGDARGSGAALAVGAALGALTLAFGDTLWEHAIKFTPYVLSALFTGLILLTMLRWWAIADERGAWRWILLLAFLFGLDFSVHRTNALLIPGAAAWVIMRKPGVLIRPSTWLAGAGGLLAGLAFQLLVIPIAAHTNSPLVLIESASWRSFWDFASLSQRGGGFLVSFWPRNSAFWSVQVWDFISALGSNFFNPSSPVLLLGCLPSLGAAIGLISLWRRNRRLGVALTVVLFLHAAMTVLYFNIPANYFRPFDRHYLPILVTIAILIAFGLGVVCQYAARMAGERRHITALIAVLFVVLLPASQLAGNWSKHDASNRWFARDYAMNALEALPANAIYFTVGDNDTFPVMYLQAAEGVRPDVRIVNLSLANLQWYVDRIANRDSTFPITRSTPPPDYKMLARAIPSTIEVPVRATAHELGLADSSRIPESLALHPQPKENLPFFVADAVLVDIIRTNAWQDPLCFAMSVGDAALGWLGDYARLDGIFWRIVPVSGSEIEPNLLRFNLLQRYSYRGYADRTVQLDMESRRMGIQYLYALRELLEDGGSPGDKVKCETTRGRLLSALPPDRLVLTDELQAQLESACG